MLPDAILLSFISHNSSPSSTPFLVHLTVVSLHALLMSLVCLSLTIADFFISLSYPHLRNHLMCIFLYLHLFLLWQEDDIVFFTLITQVKNVGLSWQKYFVSITRW